MPKELFGTDGIRGVPGTPPLDDATLFAVGRSLAAYLLREHSAAHVLIGMDTRESGPHIAERIASGLAAAGAHPVSSCSCTRIFIRRRSSFVVGRIALRPRLRHQPGLLPTRPLKTLEKRALSRAGLSIRPNSEGGLARAYRCNHSSSRTPADA